MATQQLLQNMLNGQNMHRQFNFFVFKVLQLFWEDVKNIFDKLPKNVFIVNYYSVLGQFAIGELKHRECMYVDICRVQRKLVTEWTTFQWRETSFWLSVNTSSFMKTSTLKLSWIRRKYISFILNDNYKLCYGNIKHLKNPITFIKHWKHKRTIM
jgi:hypothetical protein